MNARRIWMGLTLACLTLAAGFASNPAAARGTQGAQYGNQYRPQSDRYPQSDQGQRRMRRWHRNYRTVTVPQGTIVAVTINDNISTRRSNTGDTWQGVMQQSVIVDGRDRKSTRLNSSHSSPSRMPSSA